MSSLLPQLHDSHAVLLMQLAGELPEADRARVEQMLLTDPELRRTLAQLQESESTLAEAFATPRLTGDIDDAQRARVVARATAAIRAWQARRLAATPQSSAAIGAGRPWRGWIIATGAAAAVAAGVMIVVTMRSPSAQRNGPVVLNGPVDAPTTLSSTGPADDPIAGDENDSVASSDGDLEFMDEPFFVEATEDSVVLPESALSSSSGDRPFFDVPLVLPNDGPPPPSLP